MICGVLTITAVCYIWTARFLQHQRRMQADLYGDDAADYTRFWRRRRAIVGHIVNRVNGITSGRFEYELHEMNRALR